MPESSTNRPESPIELQSTDRYRIARDALSARIRRFVKWAEEDIAEDPYHVFNRRRLSDRSVIDFSVADDGQLIRYRLLNSSQVELMELIDFRPA
jgi:hypothetical protein